MQKWTTVVSSAILAAAMVPAIHAQANPNAIAYPSATGTQTEADEYTRYELLAPETASFKIYYEVTATTAGATSFYNCRTAASVWTTGTAHPNRWTFCSKPGAAPTRFQLRRPHNSRG